MRVFFDTSVLVASSNDGHPHYASARTALEAVSNGVDEGYIGVHSVAEVYAALTRLPVQPKIQPTEAERILNENILANFRSVELDLADYASAVQEMAIQGWTGAKIYDLLLLRCAAKCKAERIYTFNLKDFRMLAAPELAALIASP